MSAQETKNTAAQESIAAEAPTKEWSMPVLTIIAANSAENGPGALPDSGGFDFS
jgi:hypothetical protein